MHGGEDIPKLEETGVVIVSKEACENADENVKNVVVLYKRLKKTTMPMVFYSK